MGAKDRPHELVDQLTEAEAEDVLEYVEWTLSERPLEPDEWSAALRRAERIVRGADLSPEELRRDLGSG